MKVVNVIIKEYRNYTFQVKWYDASARFHPYTINRSLVRDTADEVRCKLYHVVKEARTNGINRVGECLRTLAKAGNDLYKALFQANAEAEIVKKWLSDLPKPFRIHFIVESGVYIPWGLIYDRETISTDECLDDFKIDKYKDFWCLKYSVSALYSPQIRPTSTDGKISGGRIQILPVFHKGVYSEVIPDLDESEQDAIKHIFSNFYEFEEPIFSKEHFFTYWNEFQDTSDTDTLIYFCCHADEISFALDAEDCITIKDLNIELDVKKNSTNFMFLNGCSTAVGKNERGFLEATAKESFYGFIGTESKVPDVFAIRFGLDFILTFLYSGKPVYEIIGNLRRKHWPLSLIYSIYCHPLLTISPSPENEYPVNFEHNKNFSLERLGSNELR